MRPSFLDTGTMNYIILFNDLIFIQLYYLFSNPWAGQFLVCAPHVWHPVKVFFGTLATIQRDTTTVASGYGTFTRIRHEQNLNLNEAASKQLAKDAFEVEVQKTRRDPQRIHIKLSNNKQMRKLLTVAREIAELASLARSKGACFCLGFFLPLLLICGAEQGYWVAAFFVFFLHPRSYRHCVNGV